MAKSAKTEGARRKIARSFPTELATPVTLVWHDESLFETQGEADAENKAALKAANRKVRNKLPLLFDYFEISKTEDAAIDFEALALALAIEFIPGFSIKFGHKPRGRPKADEFRLFRLLVHSEMVKRDKRRLGVRDSDRQVVEALVGQLPYSRSWHHYNKRTLLNMLTAARDPKRNPMVWLWQNNPDLQAARNLLGL
jgi:hypothetical protein